jgi:hypothetical protein
LTKAKCLSDLGSSKFKTLANEFIFVAGERDIPLAPSPAVPIKQRPGSARRVDFATIVAKVKQSFRWIITTDAKMTTRVNLAHQHWH